MIDFAPVCFILPNKLAAVSCVVHNDRIVACDGLTNCLFCFDRNGNFLERKEVLRCFRKIHYDNKNCRFLCLSGCDNRRVYFLSCCFDEVGFVELQLDNYDDEDREDTLEIMDASPETKDCQSIIIATHRRSVRAYSINGVELGFVRPLDPTRLNMNFVYSGTAEAYNYRKQCSDFVSLTNCGNSFNGTVPDQFSLRSFIAEPECNVYGLFGYKYIYNYILPIYVNGNFALPSNDDIGTIIGEISKSC